MGRAVFLSLLFFSLLSSGLVSTTATPKVISEELEEVELMESTEWKGEFNFESGNRTINGEFILHGDGKPADVADEYGLILLNGEGTAKITYSYSDSLCKWGGSHSIGFSVKGSIGFPSSAEGVGDVSLQFYDFSPPDLTFPLLEDRHPGSSPYSCSDRPYEQGFVIATSNLMDGVTSADVWEFDLPPGRGEENYEWISRKITLCDASAENCDLMQDGLIDTDTHDPNNQCESDSSDITISSSGDNDTILSGDSTASSASVSYEGLSQQNKQVLDKLAKLSESANKEGKKQFKFAVDGLKNDLQKKLESGPNTHSLEVTLKALTLWANDPGNKWGEGIMDSDDLKMSARDYATVSASQYKCNAYVAEVIYQSFDKVYRVYPSEEETGKFFPYRAKDWGNPNLNIPNFRLVNDPQMGDIWSNGRHTGIYLGDYNGIRLYISALDDGIGLVGSNVQHTHGLQIRELPSGGVFRHYVP